MVNTESRLIIFFAAKDEEELYKNDLHDQDNHDGVISNPGPDILESEVKWALESITTNKARGGGWNSSGAISNPER